MLLAILPHEYAPTDTVKETGSFQSTLASKQPFAGCLARNVVFTVNSSPTDTVFGAWIPGLGAADTPDVAMTAETTTVIPAILRLFFRFIFLLK